MFKLLMGKDVDLTAVEAYVTVYEPISGFKSVLMSKDEECGGMHTPWNTGMMAYGRRVEAIYDAILWADSEELPFFISDPTEEELTCITRLIDGMNDQKSFIEEDTTFETVKSDCFPCNRNTCEGCA